MESTSENHPTHYKTDTVPPYTKAKDKKKRLSSRPPTAPPADNQLLSDVNI